MQQVDIHKGSNASFMDIFEKIKYRLPMFILVTHGIIISQISSDDLKTEQVAKPFVNYYIGINILGGLWTFTHAFRAYCQVSQKSEWVWVNKWMFVIVEVITSCSLFACVTNYLSFNIPFALVFGLSNVTSMLVYGIIGPLVYLLNTIEETYWDDLVAKYKTIEDEADTNNFTSLKVIDERTRLLN